MTRPAASPRTADALPLLDRFAVMQRVRLCGVVLVLVAVALVPDAVAPGGRDAALGALLFGNVVLVAHVLSWLQPVRRHAVLLFSLLLLLDGVWLSWTVYVTGGAESPVRYLLLVHVAAAALVGSARTGVKVALWHSLLLYASYTAETVGVVVSTSRVDVASPLHLQQTGVFVVVLWLVALSISSLTAVNERELRRRKVDLEALTAYAEQVEQAESPSQVATYLLENLVEAHGFPRGAVLAGQDGQLALLASHGLAHEVTQAPGRPGPSPTVDSAFAEGGPLLVSGFDAEAEPWLEHLLPDAGDCVVVPLVADGSCVGALVLEQSPAAGGRIARRHVASLERSAAYAALALRNAWLLEQVTRLASVDGLTKIANRRTFETTLEREVGRATRNADCVSLVMVDIDHFKSLNDTHGHQAGDEVLRNVAAALAMECRDFDTAARYGGEEFAIVLPGCGAEEAVHIAERFRAAISRAPSIAPITGSAGVATYPRHAWDADTLVRAADEALYRSKHAGRNRTTQSTGVPPEAQVDALLRRAVRERLGVTSVTDRAPHPPPQTAGDDADEPEGAAARR